jgi:hypothetical protein
MALALVKYASRVMMQIVAPLHHLHLSLMIVLYNWNMFIEQASLDICFGFFSASNTSIWAQLINFYLSEAAFEISCTFTLFPQSFFQFNKKGILP